jgi:pilus assembly protein CpaB
MRLGSRAKLTIGVGLTAAAVFGFLGVRDLLNATSQPNAVTQPRGGNAVPRPAAVVLAATTRPIRTGETITADMIRNAALDPLRYPGVAIPAEAIGQVATRDIPANTLIPRTVLGREANLAIRVPVGMRAISIDTTAEIAVAGLIRPGDRVDVQVVYPGEDAIAGARGNGSSRARTLLQMVPILAVGELVVGSAPPPGVAASVTGTATGTTSAPPPPPQPVQTARTVTLALTPPQVAELSLAKNVGALTLSLRNPDDREQVAVAQIASSPIRAPSPVMPQVMAAPVQQAALQPAPRPARRAPAPAPHAIELVVGGNREVIYSGSGVQ